MTAIFWISAIAFIASPQNAAADGERDALEKDLQVVRDRPLQKNFEKCVILK